MFGLTLLCCVFLAGVVPDTAAPRDTERLFCSVASSSGFVSSAGLPLLAFQKPTGLDQDDAACLDAFDCYRRMRPPDAAIHAVRLSQHLEAAQHLLKCLPLTCKRLCREAAPRHACSRTPFLRVNRADTAAVAALPRACSDCALRRRDAALLIRHNIQIDYSDTAFTSTVVLAGPRPAAESAHNMTLQLLFTILSRFLHWGQDLVTGAHLENNDGIRKYAAKI